MEESIPLLGSSGGFAREDSSGIEKGENIEGIEEVAQSDDAPQQTPSHAPINSRQQSSTRLANNDDSSIDCDHDGYNYDGNFDWESGDRLLFSLVPDDSKKADARALEPNLVTKSSFSVFTMLIITLLVVLALIAAMQLDSGSNDVSTVAISDKPNFVFVLADDLGWNSMGYQDYDLNFTTPFLSKLARAGIIMDQYYALEMCSPSRASLLTGRYALTVGMQYGIIKPNSNNGLDLDEILLPEVLKDNGYDTYMFGKWHLGHYSPRYLPTARGFDSFLGYLAGETRYWSKLNCDYNRHRDLLYSNSSCYYGYDGDDIHDYSTVLYTNKAVDVIKNHDQSRGLFIYLSYQAVHDPFTDIHSAFKDGIPKSYLADGLYDQIVDEVVGRKRRQYAMALSILDSSVETVYNTLNETGMLENTYIIFASDNGGCFQAGGRNGPLRGTKGSLFEGGVRVDSFVYSSLLPQSVSGQLYTPIFHVSDWFPTILELADIEYVPDVDNALDGVSHVEGWYSNNTLEPRSHVLINYYFNVGDYNYNMWSNGSFAIRDKQYKLLHTYDSSTYGNWYEPETAIDDDAVIGVEVNCSPTKAFGSDDIFTYYLFDLNNDPYETDNIYNDTSEEIEAVKTYFYNLMESFEANSKNSITLSTKHHSPMAAWKEREYYVSPWAKEEDLVKVASGSYPKYCRPEGISFSYEPGSDDVHSRPDAAE